MPRILVMTDDHQQVVMDELVRPEQVNSTAPDLHFSHQLIERLGWGIEDAALAQAQGAPAG